MIKIIVALTFFGSSLLISRAQKNQVIFSELVNCREINSAKLNVELEKFSSKGKILKADKSILIVDKFNSLIYLLNLNQKPHFLIDGDWIMRNKHLPIVVIDFHKFSVQKLIK